MTWTRGLLLFALLIAGPTQLHAAEPFLEQDLRIPMAAAGPKGLEAILVRPNQPGRYPLALINHGSPRSAADRPNMSPWAMLPQALEFARRGWTAVVVMRRGYGGSGGAWAEGYGGCDDPDYVAAGTASAEDLKAAIAELVKRPDIDRSKILSIGVSAGGFATLALMADPPEGLVATLNFAGGRGSVSDDDTCSPDRLVDAARSFGEQAKIPTLWVYAKNDHFFGPALARKMKDAFAEGGDTVEFVAAPAFGSEGHLLFSPAGIPVWTAEADQFLKQQGLELRASPLPPPPRPELEAPESLSASGRSDFESYLISGPHKAFAVAPDGSYGWKSGERTTTAAEVGALENCGAHSSDCSVAFVDDVEAP